MLTRMKKYPHDSKPWQVTLAMCITIMIMIIIKEDLQSENLLANLHLKY